MPDYALLERRWSHRQVTEGLLALIRRKGRLTRLQGMAADFNRHGIGLVLDQPVPKDALVYVSLIGAGRKIENVIGIVHNCNTQATGYRCGIQFRTHSNLQHDRCAVERALASLENALTEQLIVLAK